MKVPRDTGATAIAYAFLGDVRVAALCSSLTEMDMLVAALVLLDQAGLSVDEQDRIAGIVTASHAWAKHRSEL